jgi:hypothetical protein
MNYKFFEIRHRSFWVKDDGRIFNENDVVMRNYTDDGYLSLKLKFVENGKVKYVAFLQHRIVAELFIPNPEEKPYVIHLDGDKTNNKVKNLAWTTHEERYKHQFDLGLFKSPKLSAKQVVEIKKHLKKNKYTRAAIAEQYGVSHTQIKRIAIGENWSYAV